MKIWYEYYKTKDLHPSHLRFITGPEEYPHTLDVRFPNNGSIDEDYANITSLKLTLWLEKNMIGVFHREGILLFLSSDEDLVTFKMRW